MSNQTTQTAVQLIMRFSKAFDVKLEQESKIPLSQVQFIALEYIHNNGSIPMKALAEHLSITPASTSTMVKKLEAMGYITRTPDEYDGRVSRLSLCQEGIEIYKACYIEAGQIVEFFLNRLEEDEREQLVNILQKMLQSED